jgi:[acyl-carrier-protein] S-malonyltransferase
MARALIDISPAAAEAFGAADEALAEPISTLTFDGPEEDLNLTVNAQPAILATSIAYLSALDELAAAAPPAFYAGHSMGQYSAMVAAGVLSLADGMRLVRERGRQMQASAEGGAMAAVIGLPDDQIGRLIEAGSVVGSFTVANRNSPGQIVVSGEQAAVERACEVARELGAKRAIVLPVSVAAHSPLMTRAADEMRRILAGIEFRDPRAPLLANADGRPLATGAECRAELVEHLTRGVDWVAAVEHMTTAGVSSFVEVGPGKVLTGLIKRIAPGAEAYALDDQAADGRLAVPPFLTASPAGALS